MVEELWLRLEKLTKDPEELFLSAGAGDLNEPTMGPPPFKDVSSKLFMGICSWLTPGDLNARGVRNAPARCLATPMTTPEIGASAVAATMPRMRLRSFAESTILRAPVFKPQRKTIRPNMQAKELATELAMAAESLCPSAHWSAPRNTMTQQHVRRTYVSNECVSCRCE
jgi:hypothetical protein